MTERKPLPDGLASDVRHLVLELRVLKDRAGLSLAALAQRTPYSKSSWERYLNGKALPPQHAVTSLGKLADADPARLMALWDLANTAWHEAEAPSEAPGDARSADEEEDAVSAAPPGEPEPPAGRPFADRRLVWSAAAVALAAALAVSVAALSGAFGGGSGEHDDGNGTAGTDTSTRQVDVSCFAESCEGKDPRDAGCGDVWTAALQRIDGVYVELRYSDACKAAWSRISWGHPGDAARVVARDGRTHQKKVSYDTDTFSPMVAAPSPTVAQACIVRTSGVRGCTDWGGTHHLNEAPEPPASLLTPTSTPADPTADPNHSPADPTADPNHSPANRS
ncbi:DUF2690 domain-containing protein [Streptomyces sp. NPDC020917]|uniref:helix-turn-helix domain-containing protein n=1 Tax=Streptomyces sp. NPDC020917 TaxID=3365102 RepID=UPI003791ED21